MSIGELDLEVQEGATKETKTDEAVMLLELILPLAKGYAASHPVGSNQNYVNEVDRFLVALRQKPVANTIMALHPGPAKDIVEAIQKSEESPYSVRRED